MNAQNYIFSTISYTKSITVFGVIQVEYERLICTLYVNWTEFQEDKNLFLQLIDFWRPRYRYGSEPNFSSSHSRQAKIFNKLYDSVIFWLIPLNSLSILHYLNYLNVGTRRLAILFVALGNGFKRRLLSYFVYFYFYQRAYKWRICFQIVGHG